MSITLYYFSATGNSLSTARILEEELSETHLISMASTKSYSKVIADSDTVGFVFPVYYSSIPYPVRELISKMVFRPDTYIFIFTTFRDRFGDVAKKTDQLLKTRGQKLSLFAGIPMPGNSVLSEPWEEREHLKNQRDNIARYLESIQKKEVLDYSEAGSLPVKQVDYPNNFRGLIADESCIGCGTCVKVCPMNNIMLKDGKAEIGDDCATCLACFHWCPVEAIWMSRQPGIARRRKYRHPDITLQDILSQKR